MVTDGQRTYCDDRFAVYANIESLGFTSETTMSYVNYTSIKNFKNFSTFLTKNFLKDEFSLLQVILSKLPINRNSEVLIFHHAWLPPKLIILKNHYNPSSLICLVFHKNLGTMQPHAPFLLVNSYLSYELPN